MLSMYMLKRVGEIGHSCLTPLFVRISSVSQSQDHSYFVIKALKHSN